MSLKTFFIYALIATGVMNVSGTPLSVIETAPIVDSSDHVMTPAGLRPRENVHLVPDGARVHQTSDAVHIISESGEILHTTPLDSSSAASSISSRDLPSGYVAYSYTKNTAGSPISSFSTSWTVPPTPATQSGQVIYIFNALIPTSFDAILQPVLQFGSGAAGGGNYWAIASWWILGSSTFHTNLVKVTPGKALEGVMKLTRSSATSYSYSSSFTGVTGTTMSITSTEELTYVYEALEIYTAPSKAYLPTGTTSLSGINILTQNGKPLPMNWTSVIDSTDGFQLNILNGTSTNGRIDIVYPK
ncbi:hypothetical protein BDQ12DRAFT_760161 [Crucibulum laeve]|uniref:Uncharacterized protein n=1 Tax=Crucibulum laeve TaxID=68775 RepID=A0A5C3LR63_9AGAR|nr:hypothetical protein BDQ12DRAFT_760161 [Crucibulum laeve]